MSKQEIIDYVTTTPDNTNKAILGQMLDELSEYDLVFEIDFFPASASIENITPIPKEKLTKVIDKITQKERVKIGMRWHWGNEYGTVSGETEMNIHSLGRSIEVVTNPLTEFIESYPESMYVTCICFSDEGIEDIKTYHKSFLWNN